MSGSGVEIDKISIAYGEAVPVRDLSLTVRPGEFLALLGPSGCGKTTTLRAVAGFVTPVAGDVRIAGTSVRDVPPDKRNIGMVYQDYALFPHLTVADNIAFGMRMRKRPAAEIRTRVAAALDQLQLTGLGGRRPRELSGGQQQRVALARALVIDPALLLLDEPLAALDRQLRADMQFELRRLQQSVGITTMFVTHDQEEALSLSDRIAVMNSGRILQVDTPAAVYDRPADRFVAAFIGVANFLAADVAAGGQAARMGATGGPARLASPHAPGAVELMLRPEKIRIREGDAPGGTPDTLCGQVVGAVFVGTVIKYQVAVTPDLVMRVDTPVDGAPLPVGSTATLTWRAEDVRLYREGRFEA